MAHYQVAPTEAYPLFDLLVARYQEPHRHYHNLEHISEMGKIVGKLADGARDLNAIYLAVWFHDAVYDPKAKDNEARSVALMRESLTPLGIPVAVIDHVQAMIMATTHGSLTTDDPDTMILLDADLAVLGAEERRYVRYAEAIRREYEWVEESAYRKGRIHVLEGFLQRGRIYCTERMHIVGDEPARCNLKWEIELLRG